MKNMKKLLSFVLAMAMVVSLCSVPAFAAEATSWDLNAQIADLADGTALPAYDAAVTGVFQGLTQSNKDNTVTVVEDGGVKYVRAQHGWGGASTELILNLPETYSTGKLIAKFDMLVESTVADYDWENGLIEWVEGGFASDDTYIARALVGGSNVNKLDWDGDLLGTTQAHEEDIWYNYEITVDLDNNTRSMIVRDANGNELGHTDPLAIDEAATVNKVRFVPVCSGDFTDSAYLVANLVVAVDELPEGSGSTTPTNPTTSTPAASTPTASIPAADPDATSWILNDQIADVAAGTALPANGTTGAGIFTGVTQSNKDNTVTVAEDGDLKYVRAQSGWGGGSTEIVLDLPQTYTAGKLIAKFDMLVESTVVSVDWEDGMIEWVEAGFAGSDWVARAMAGASNVNKLDWDGDLLGAAGCQDHAEDVWYNYEIIVDLDANTRQMIVRDANGNELGHTDALSIAEDASVSKVRFMPICSGGFTDSAYLVANLVVAVDALPEGGTTSTPTTSTPSTSTPTTSTPTTSIPAVDPTATEWILNDQIADAADGTALPANGTAGAGVYTGVTQSNKDNTVTVVEDSNGKYVRAQHGWGGGNTEIILDLPQTYTTGKLVAKFDMLIESTVVDVDWENGKIEWVEAGFANGSEYVARALVGGSDVNKLDWDGDLLGASQAHNEDTWYTYEITVDLDANTRSMIVYDASGSELGHTDGLTIAEDAAVNKVRFLSLMSGDFCDEAYLVRNLEVSYEGDQVIEPSEAVTVSGTITSTGSGTVTVELIKNGAVAASTTTTTGSYSIANVEAGSYTLKVTKSKHAAREYDVTVGTANVTQDAAILLLGDVNGDGAVNTRDALQINRSSAKKSSVFDTQDADADYRQIVADVNGDSAVNTRDALQINRSSAKKSSLFDSLA